MPSLDGWLTGSADSDIVVLPAAQRAALAWRRINDRPSSVVLIRAGTPLAAQTMRIEFDNSSSMVNGTLVRTGVQRLTLFGVKNHPTIADTNIQRGDRFNLGLAQYEVKSVLTPPGETQGLCES